jgi:hypothetical protein
MVRQATRASDRANVFYRPIADIAAAVQIGKMPKTQPRDVTGVLERHIFFLFVRDASGHHWRLDVEEARVAHLAGLKVRVTGKAATGIIRVESITRA